MRRARERARLRKGRARVCGSHLEVAVVDAHGRLGHAQPAHKAQVERPDALVLRDGQRAQRAVEGLARVRRARQPEQKLEVLEPDARHLVHEDERALKHHHRLLARGADGRLARELGAALAEVHAPELEAAGQVLERALEEHVARHGRRLALGLEVAQPVLEREAVAEQVLLVEDVLHGLRGRGRRGSAQGG